MISVNRLLELEHHALTAEDVDPDTKKPGQCWRTQRLVIEQAGLPSPGPGLDAAEAAVWYRDHGHALKKGANTVPGDFFFWLHGKHGHVGMRILGNQLGENSSVHSTDGSDARGKRLLKELVKPDIVVRLVR